MKRHKSLVPLSKEHHQALILAQLVKRNAPHYKSMPETLEDKALYAIKLYREELAGHFRGEELMIEKMNGIDPNLDQLGMEIIAEHKTIIGLFLVLETTDDLEAELNKLGNELEAHIRKEERIWFPLIQKKCPENLLEQLQQLLS